MQFTHLPRLLLAAGFLAVRVKADSVGFTFTGLDLGLIYYSISSTTPILATKLPPYLQDVRLHFRHPLHATRILDT